VVEAKVIPRRIVIDETPSGEPELYLFCPLQRKQTELDRCVPCRFYRGLDRQPDGNCHLRCCFPDAVLSLREVAAPCS
jgi:hypothetical protein